MLWDETINVLRLIFQKFIRNRGKELVWKTVSKQCWCQRQYQRLSELTKMWKFDQVWFQTSYSLFLRSGDTRRCILKSDVFTHDTCQDLFDNLFLFEIWIAKKRSTLCSNFATVCTKDYFLLFWVVKEEGIGQIAGKALCKKLQVNDKGARTALYFIIDFEIWNMFCKVQAFTVNLKYFHGHIVTQSFRSTR